ncbi:MAG: response regulator [Oligoflexales bacterium]
MSGDLLDDRPILVVDDDIAIQNLMKRQLSDIGAHHIDTASRGDDAWGLLCDHHYRLIILDWRLPGLGGVTLFNRLRLKVDYARTPILVVSGFVTKKDFSLLDDYPCTDFLEKPFSKLQTEQAVEDLLKTSNWYVQSEEKLSLILKKHQRNPVVMVEEVDKIIAGNPKPLAICLIVARYLRKMENYHDASLYAKKALNYDKNSLAAMTEMAKILHLQGQIDSATKMLRMVSQISMQNIDRLCLLGELEMTSGKPKEARQVFAKALDLDSECEKAKTGTEFANQLEEFQAHSQESIPQNLAGIANIMGISLAKKGKLKEAEKTYHAAMSFLTDRSEQAKIWFNLGICHLKYGDHKKGIALMEKSVQCGGDVFLRAGQVLDQLRFGNTSQETIDFYHLDDEELHDGVYDQESFGISRMWF